MNIEITNYRGYSISFNTETETFLSDIGNDGTEKKSFAATKKAIDDFIKDNQVFVPFEIMDLYWDGGRLKKIIGIRKDGKFVYEHNGKKEQLTEYNAEHSYLRSDWEQFDRTELNKLIVEKELIEEKIRIIRNQEKEFLATKPTLKDLKPKYLI
jgi:hypothetical protein